MEKLMALACIVAGGLGFCWADDEELGRDVCDTLLSILCGVMGVVGWYVL